MSDRPPLSITERRALGQAITRLVLDVFRLNAELLSTGDTLVRDLDLTSARWQVLGAVAASPVPLSVAHLARTMGLSRQSVQRVVDDLQRADMVRLQPNPHHRRAALVVMSEVGEAAYRTAGERQERWVDELASGLSAASITTASELLQTLRQRLSASGAAENDV